MDPVAAFALLELTASATEADIRRAYARKLKDFRPDEDPEGFQRLVRARDIALARARFIASTAAAASLAGGPPPKAAPAASPQAEERPPEPEAPQETATGNASQQARDQEAPSSTPDKVPPPPAGNPVRDKPAGAEPPQAPPRPKPAPEAPSSVDPVRISTPAEVLDALRAGLKRLIERQAPFEVRSLETMLLELPAGANRSIEPAAIQEISRVLQVLLLTPYPAPVVESFERLGVMLTDYFRWQDNDRAIFTVLSLEDAARFEGFLGSAHKLHAPGKETRFTRPKPAAAPPPKPQPKSGGEWRWLIFVLIAAGMIVRSIGQISPQQQRTPLPQVWSLPQVQYTGKDLNESDPLRMFLRVPGAQAPATPQPATQPVQPVLKQLEAKLVFDPSRDYETVIWDYEERLRTKDPAPLRFFLSAVDRYVERGMAEDALSLLDRMAASEIRLEHSNYLSGYRGTIWLQAFGWSDRLACKRVNPARRVTLTPEGEARTRKALQEAVEHASSGTSASIAARLLELCDHLVSQKRFGEVDALLSHLSELASHPPLHERNVPFEIASIRRCLLPATGH